MQIFHLYTLSSLSTGAQLTLSPLLVSYSHLWNGGSFLSCCKSPQNFILSRQTALYNLSLVCSHSHVRLASGSGAIEQLCPTAQSVAMDSTKLNYSLSNNSRQYSEQQSTGSLAVCCPPYIFWRHCEFLPMFYTSPHLNQCTPPWRD